MCRCRPTKAVQAYQWLSCERQVHDDPFQYIYFGYVTLSYIFAAQVFHIT